MSVCVCVHERERGGKRDKREREWISAVQTCPNLTLIAVLLPELPV